MFDTLMVFLKEFFDNFDFEKKSTDGKKSCKINQHAKSTIILLQYQSTQQTSMRHFFNSDSHDVGTDNIFCNICFDFLGENPLTFHVHRLSSGPYFSYFSYFSLLF